MMQVAGTGAETAKLGEPARTKLLFVAPPSRVRGPMGGIVETLVESLLQEGYSVRLMPWGRRSDIENRLGRVYTWLQDTRRVLAQAAEWQPDAVVLHTGSDWVTHVRDLPLIVVLRMAGTRVVAELHGSQVEELSRTGHNAFKALSRFFARQVIGLLLLNKESVDVWKTFEPNVRTAAVQNPFAPLKGSRAVIRVIDSDEPIRLVFVAHVLPRKGLRDVVRALAEIHGERPVTLSVVGDGPDLAGALKLANRLGVSALVDARGRMDSSGVAEQLSQSDIMVFPTYHPEGLPTVVLEAMGAGLPIVTTRRWGTADWLEPGIHAVFTPAKDPHALAEAVVRLADDVDLRRRMSAANLERIVEFAPDVVSARYAAALQTMLYRTDGELGEQGCSPQTTLDSGDSSRTRSVCSALFSSPGAVDTVCTGTFGPHGSAQ
jgi:glycosyltransferase involved in cell wall biosynthesis